MNYPPAKVVQQFLLDQALGTNESLGQSWPAFVATMPDSPDESLCVYDTTALKDGRISATGEVVEHPGVQVRVRSRTYLAGWRKAEAVRGAVDAILRSPVTVDSEHSYTIHNASRTSGVLSLGQEQEGTKKRFDFTLNLLLTLSEET